MKSKKGGKRTKVFKERVSLLDHLNENTFINGFFKTFQVQLAIFFIYIVLRDSCRAGSICLSFTDKDRDLIGYLRDWLIFAGVECLLLLLFLLMYMIFLVWMYLWGGLGKVANVIYFLVYVVYVWGTFHLVSKVMYGQSLAAIPRFIAFVEQMRLSMKMYSFIRENAYKVLYPWHKDDQSGPAIWYAGQMSPKVGSFSQYVYFLFAPTLLYRDNYPRNNGAINWRNVFIYGFLFLSILFVSKVIFLEVQYPKSMRMGDLIESVLAIFLASPLMAFSVNFIVIHSWFNFTGEMTRFGDREFYQGWWLAVGYTEYYRMWNIPIFDFIGQYMYQEISYYKPSFRPLGGLVAILASSITHDYLASVGTGVYFPLFVIFFALMGGVVFISGVKFTKCWTFFFTCLGMSLMQCFYHIELGARRYCGAKEEWSVWALRAPSCFVEQNQDLISKFL